MYLIMTDSSENVEGYIKKEIKKSGFPLEIFSSITLSKYGWAVKPHVIFYNEETKNYNELDIHAMNWTKGFDKRAGTRDILIIQCKKQTEKPWVFFQQDIPNKDVFSLNITPMSNYGWFDKYFKDHYYFDKKPCSFHFPSFTEKRNPDIILNAINQVINALLFFIEQELSFLEEHASKHVPRVSFFYPVIILDGMLFSAQVNPDGKIELTESQYLQLNVTRAMKEPLRLKWSRDKSKVLFQKEFVIDIVQKNYLEEFLKNLS